MNQTAYYRALPAAALFLSLPAFGAETPTAAADRPQTTEIQMAALAAAEAAYRTVPREYRLDGIVEAVNRTTVSAQTQGQVEEILYDVDDVVSEGDVLVRLRDTEHRARVAQAAAELKAATAQLEQARDEHRRVKGLYQKKNVSDSAMDQAEAALTGAQARLEAAQAGLEQAQEQLDYTQIRAPYSGIVTQRHVEIGEMASPGGPIMSGVSLDRLRVLIDVPQSVIPAVRERGQVQVQLPDGIVVAPEKITVFPFAERGSNTFKVRVDLPAGTDGLFPGMFVKTAIVTGEKQELMVPEDAVVYRSEVTGVYVIGDDGHVSLRQIRVGRAHGDALVVLSGLTEGEQVALDPIAAGVALKAEAQARVSGGGQQDG